MTLKSIIHRWFPLAGLLVIVVLFLFFVPEQSEQEFDIKSWFLIEKFETHNLYMWILIGTIFFPFILSFDKRVQFYTQWLPLVKATIFPALIFILWDIIFTKNGVWSFNHIYITGKNIMGLPIEEILWFLVIPYCCVFIYECINHYLGPRWNERVIKAILILMLIIMTCITFFYIDQIYTALTFTAGAFFCIIMLFDMRSQFVTSFLITWLISLIPFLMVNGILTGAITEEPIVAYSPDAIIGIRIGSIPIEDAIYLWSYLFIILWGFDFYKKIDKKRNQSNPIGV